MNAVPFGVVPPKVVFQVYVLFTQCGPEQEHVPPGHSESTVQYAPAFAPAVQVLPFFSHWSPV